MHSSYFIPDISTLHPAPRIQYAQTLEQIFYRAKLVVNGRHRRRANGMDNCATLWVQRGGEELVRGALGILLW